MTLTFDSKKYSELLLKYQPKLIRTEEENERALMIVEELMHRSNRTPEDNELYDLLVALIEKFEQEFYEPGQISTPHSILLFLMEQQEVTSQDLVKVFGSHEVVTQIIEGKRKICQDEAIALSVFFGVDASLLIE